MAGLHRGRRTWASVSVTAALLGGAGAATFAAPAASAAPKTITAVTHTSDHADTTSVPTGCTLANEVAQGPVWAFDNLSLRLTATDNGDGTWAVRVTAHGSFAAVCDPVSGDYATGHGSVNGWYDLTVTSPVAPSGKSLPAHAPSDESQTQIVAQFFGVNTSSVVGGQYNYTYNRVDGGKYVQSG